MAPLWDSNFRQQWAGAWTSQVLSRKGKVAHTQWLKIIEKVSFTIASEASYVYILSGQKVH